MSWPGLTRPSTPSRQTIVEIIPHWIFREDQRHLPGARPMLEIVLALDRGADVGMTLGVDETLQPVTLGETLCDAFAMFPGALGEIAGDPDVKRAVGSVSHDVDPSFRHGTRLPHGVVDGRVKPGHDIKNCCRAVMAGLDPAIQSASHIVKTVEPVVLRPSRSRCACAASFSA